MKSRFVLLIIILAVFSTTILIGCSSGQSAPVTPAEKAPATGATHYVWGLWQFTTDPAEGRLDIVQLRSGDFHLNALVFLEPPPLVNLTLESLKFTGNIIDADIGLKHPFLGLTEFTGFDVCGVLITNGSYTGFTDPALRLASTGDTRLLNSDGLTRWWNPAEFPVNTKTIFGYNDGLLGTPDSVANYNSTLNAYKYFCDDLGPDDPLSNITVAGRGMFSAGKKNVRHYTIELGAGLTFNYAVDASWQFPTGDKPWVVPDDFGPGANKVEPWRADITEITNTLWNDGTDKGGTLSFTIDLYDRFHLEKDIVCIESPGSFAPSGPLASSGGGEGYSTYQIDIPSATPVTSGSINVLIIAQCENTGYGNLLPGKTEAAYFLYTPKVSGEQATEPVCDLQVVTPMPYIGWATAIKFDASASYDPGGKPLTFEWDFNDDGTFGDPHEYGTPDKPAKYFGADYAGDVCVRVSNGAAYSDCCKPVDITAYPSKNIQLRSDATAMDIAINNNTGDLFIFYNDGPTAASVWKYTHDLYYATGLKQFDTLWNQWLWDTTHKQFLEINPDGYFLTGGTVYVESEDWYCPQAFYYKPDASVPFDFVHLWSCQFMEPMPEHIYHDVFTLGTSGGYPNDMGIIYGYDYSGSHWLRVWKNPDPDFATVMSFTNSFSGTDYSGQSRLYWKYVAAAEGDRDGDCLWFVENTDCYGSRWALSSSSLTYDDAYFGTGTPDDADTTWNNAKDLTRDNLNRYYVLDELSTGDARVKAWDVSSSPGTSLGGFGNSIFISGDPQRIEGSDYSPFIVVLHGASSPQMISIFSGSELPE